MRSFRSRRAVRAPFLCWLLVPVLACAPMPGPEELTAQSVRVPDPGARSPAEVLDSILTTPPLDRAHWGVTALDLSTGEPVLRHGGRRLFIAASTMKLVTAAAALDLLGPDYRFETAIEAEIDEAGRASRLRVIGGGDPSLGSPFHEHPLAPLDSLADSLATAGLREVAGPVIVDQSRFDSVLVHPAWETFDLDWYYAAPVAPFAVMGAAIEVVVAPAAPGAPARVTLPHAAELVTVDARIRTVPGTDDWNDRLRRPPERDSLVLRGTIGAGAGPDTSWIAQTDPGRTAGRALVRALGREGIPVSGPVEVRYRPDADAASPGGRPIRVVWRSPPLDAIIRVTLEQSDNWVTEQVLKTLAATLRGQGDWPGATHLAERYLTERVGIERNAVYMRDGSGLTHQGLLSPDAVVTLLRYAAGRPWGEAFRHALASPGEPESTLEDRLLEQAGRVQAKTGTLRHVNALSGFARTLDGRELVFCILSNGSGQPSWRMQPALDRILESLIESGS